jgi:hypothetical protein
MAEKVDNPLVEETDGITEGTGGRTIGRQITL